MGKGRQEKCVPNRVQSCSTRMPGIVQCQIEGSEFKNIFQDYDFMRVLDWCFILFASFTEPSEDSGYYIQFKLSSQG